MERRIGGDSETAVRMADRHHEGDGERWAVLLDHAGYPPFLVMPAVEIWDYDPRRFELYYATGDDDA